MYLTNDDKKVLTLVRTFGCCPVSLVKDIMTHGTDANVRAACHVLTSEGLCFYSKHRDYLLKTPYYHPMYRTADALALIVSMGAEVKSVFRPEKPGLAGFIRKNKCYFVYSAFSDFFLTDSVNVIKDDANAKIENEKDRESVIYLFLTENDVVIKPLKDFPYPYVFALMDKDKTFTFYKPEA